MIKRRGSLILEAAISSLLLATATVGLLKMAKSASILTLQSDQRIGLSLAADNAAERIALIPFESIVEQVDAVAENVSKKSNCVCGINTEPFESNGKKGIHLQITTKISNRVSLTQHRWRIDTPEATDE